jgi:hypothetical protein
MRAIWNTVAVPAPVIAAQPVGTECEGIMPTINLNDDELAAVAALIPRTIEGDRYPHAPRLDPLRAALGKFEVGAEREPLPKAPMGAKGKRPRRTP